MIDMNKRYRLYVDEAGDHVYSQDENNVVSRYLGITGVIFDMDYYKDFVHTDFTKLKERHFSHHPDEPVIFHRKELINKKGPFRPLLDSFKEQSFNQDLLQTFERYDMKLFTVVLDKYSHFRKYGEHAPHPYHYAVSAILELYCNFLNILGRTGDVLAESRGAREDTYLKEAYRTIWTNGTNLQAQDFFQKSLTTDEIKIQPKSANITGLQIADLLAYPCRAELLYLKDRTENLGGIYGQKLCQVIRDKHSSLFLE